MTEIAGRPELTGTVDSFDDHVGLGEIVGDDGCTYPFHCVEIADGSRSIRVGLAVRFRQLPKLGRVEAASIRPA